MEHYVTLFDNIFLPQGLALHLSMERHAGSYTLWILCVDNITFDILQQIDLPNVCLLQLEKLETDELRRVRLDRTNGEYCWTLTPFAPRWVFETDASVRRVTYIDADMWLRKSPAPIFLEFERSGKQILITDHGYAPEYDQSATSGQYCVQFMTFNREGSDTVRKWWEERCIEWCYGRSEDGKYGDQKYLDDWPERFSDKVHVLNHQEWMLAPWNSIRFPYSGAICHHFHGLRIVDNSVALLGYAIPPVVIENIYHPYLADLRAVCDFLREIGHQVVMQRKMVRHGRLKQIKDMILGLVAYRWRFSQHKTRMLSLFGSVKKN